MRLVYPTHVKNEVDAAQVRIRLPRQKRSNFARSGGRARRRQGADGRRGSASDRGQKRRPDQIVGAAFFRFFCRLSGDSRSRRSRCSSQSIRSFCAFAFCAARSSAIRRSTRSPRHPKCSSLSPDPEFCVLPARETLNKSNLRATDFAALGDQAHQAEGDKGDQPGDGALQNDDADRLNGAVEFALKRRDRRDAGRIQQRKAQKAHARGGGK